MKKCALLCGAHFFDIHKEQKTPRRLSAGCRYYLVQSYRSSEVVAPCVALLTVILNIEPVVLVAYESYLNAAGDSIQCSGA